jgi:hypothetical protein
LKLNLLLNSNETRAGFVSLSPFKDSHSPEDILQSSVTNLEAVCLPAQATEILALDILDFLPVGIIDSTIQHWSSRLHHRGIITIGGVDVYQVALALTNRNIDEKTANELIYGQGLGTWSRKNSMTSLPRLKTLLQSLGLKISDMSTHNLRYIVKAVRP